MLDAEHGKADGLFVHRRGFAPVGDTLDDAHAVIGEHASHALRRAFGPAANDDPFSPLLQLPDMGRRRLENIDPTGGFGFAALLRTLGREVAPRPAAGIGRMDRIRRRER